MKMIQSFDPSLTTSGTFSPQTVNSCGRIYLFNESPYGLQLTFQNGDVAGLPPYYFRSYKVGKPGIVTWKQIYSIAQSGSPLSTVVGEAYESAEAEDIRFTEGPLNRQTNVPNIVNTSGGTVASVQNDGNPSVVFVEGTVFGDSSSDVSIKNDGTMTLGTVTNPGSLTVQGPIVANTTLESKGAATLDSTLGVTGTTSLATTNVSNTLTVTGANIQFDNNKGILVKDTGGTYRELLTLSNTNKPLLFSSGGNFEFRDVSGNLLYSFSYSGSTILINSSSLTVQTSGGQAIITSSSVNTHVEASNGVTLKVNGNDIVIANAGSVTLTQRLILSGVGGMTANSTFTGSGTTAGVAHGLGTTPDFIEISCTAAGSTATFGYSALTSTTCTITAGAAVAWKAVAWKF